MKNFMKYKGVLSLQDLLCLAAKFLLFMPEYQILLLTHFHYPRSIWFFLINFFKLLLIMQLLDKVCHLKYIQFIEVAKL